MTSKNKALLHNYHEDIWNGHRLDLLDTYIDPNFRSHATPTGSPSGAGPIRDFLTMVFQAFPDLQSTENILLGDEDKVVIHWTVQATHQGDFLGMAATGKSITVSGMDILRVVDDRFVEHWGGFGDQIPKVMQQIDDTP